MEKVVDYKGRKFRTSNLGPGSERHERGFIIKPRRMHKGDGRPVGVGWCVNFTYKGRRYKSGGYYHKEGAIRWGCNQLDKLEVDVLRGEDAKP